MLYGYQGIGASPIAAAINLSPFPSQRPMDAQAGGGLSSVPTVVWIGLGALMVGGAAFYLFKYKKA